MGPYELTLQVVSHDARSRDGAVVSQSEPLGSVWSWTFVKVGSKNGSTAETTYATRRTTPNQCRKRPHHPPRPIADPCRAHAKRYAAAREFFGGLAVRLSRRSLRWPQSRAVTVRTHQTCLTDRLTGTHVPANLSLPFPHTSPARSLAPGSLRPPRATAAVLSRDVKNGQSVNA